MDAAQELTETIRLYRESLERTTANLQALRESIAPTYHVAAVHDDEGVRSEAEALGADVAAAAEGFREDDPWYVFPAGSYVVVVDPDFPPISILRGQVGRIVGTRDTPITQREYKVQVGSGVYDCPHESLRLATPAEIELSRGYSLTSGRAA